MVALTHKKIWEAEMQKNHKAWPVPLRNVNELWGEWQGADWLESIYL